VEASEIDVSDENVVRYLIFSPTLCEYSSCAVVLFVALVRISTCWMRHNNWQRPCCGDRPIFVRM